MSLLEASAFLSFNKGSEAHILWISWVEWATYELYCVCVCFLFENSEILGALLSILCIWVVTGVLVYLACQRLLHPDYHIQGTVMIIVSACAVVANVM